MFLINSRTPLVIETCYLHSRHPLYRRYGANMPNSLKSIPLIRLGLLSQGHLSRFWVRLIEIIFLLFHGLPASLKHCCRSLFALLLAITALHRTIQVRSPDKGTLASPKCQKKVYRCRRFEKYANMNAFPIRVTPCYGYT